MFMLYFESIMAGRCRKRRYADHIFIQIYFRMHHFVVKFSNCFRLRRQGTPRTKILRTCLDGTSRLARYDFLLVRLL